MSEAGPVKGGAVTQRTALQLIEPPGRHREHVRARFNELLSRRQLNIADSKVPPLITPRPSALVIPRLAMGFGAVRYKQ